MRILLATTLILGAGTALAETATVTADIWVDNWFTMFVNGTHVIEDSVPITTERSFNAETVTFTADLPMTVAIQAKDFKQDDTGLEYIGTNRQQMGDGGMIAQFRDATIGKIIGVTTSDMRCLVVHRAPLNKSCSNENNPVAGQGNCDFESLDVPDNWTASNFDDSAWPKALEYSENAVSPKQGYDKINWDNAARLIWSADLEQDNTLLCRVTFGG
ncbi:MAG: PEBP family protein [Hyphomicrobiales bacterium]|uniref:hypothetical protein n=1 Tax=Nisaea sp. TaxID=2024842 RepID=UPI0032691711